MMEVVMRDPRIAQAVWWAYDFHGSPNEWHRLTRPDGRLSAEGQVYRELIPLPWTGR
jgi:hypothetical protein